MVHGWSNISIARTIYLSDRMYCLRPETERFADNIVPIIFEYVI